MFDFEKGALWLNQNSEKGKQIAIDTIKSFIDMTPRDKHFSRVLGAFNMAISLIEKNV